MKIPIIKYVHNAFMESQTISDEFIKNSRAYLDLIKQETGRIKQSTTFSSLYYEYFFDNFLYLLNSYVKIFIRDI